MQFDWSETYPLVRMRTYNFKMASTGDADVLFEIRTALYLGNYQQCINEAQKLKVNIFFSLLQNHQN